MKITRTMSLSLALALTVSCSFSGQKYSNSDGTPATYAGAGAPDTVTTQGLGSDAGYESLQQVSAGGKTAVAKNNVFYFSFDDTRLRDGDMRFIEEQSKYLLNHPNAQIFLGGHADERGSREYNVGLGERRAKRVAEVLQLSGVPTRQIRVVSYGREKPQVLGHNEAAWRKNRRVEFIYESLG